MLGENSILLLIWLSEQGMPAWGGHIERGEPLADPDIKLMLSQGYIKLVEGRGYMITDKGLNVLRR